MNYMLGLGIVAVVAVVLLEAAQGASIAVEQRGGIAWKNKGASHTGNLYRFQKRDEPEEGEFEAAKREYENAIDEEKRFMVMPWQADSDKDNGQKKRDISKRYFMPWQAAYNQEQIHRGENNKRYFIGVTPWGQSTDKANNGQKKRDLSKRYFMPWQVAHQQDQINNGKNKRYFIGVTPWWQSGDKDDNGQKRDASKRYFMPWQSAYGQEQVMDKDHSKRLLHGDAMADRMV